MTAMAVARSDQGVAGARGADAESLRAALLILAPSGFWAAWRYWAAGRTIVEEHNPGGGLRLSASAGERAEAHISTRGIVFIVLTSATGSWLSVAAVRSSTVKCEIVALSEISEINWTSQPGR